MDKRLTRRSILVDLGHAAAVASLATVLPRTGRAGQASAAAPLKVCLSMLYPAGTDAAGAALKFDADAFRDRHVALLKQTYGPAVERVELRVSLPPPAPAEGAPPPPAPPLLAAVSLWLSDIGEFIKRAQTGSKTINADMATITNSAPMVQFDVIEGQSGDPRAAVAVASNVVSSYFFTREGGTWNAKYFAADYMQKLVAAYGAAAIQRVEVARGEIAQGGGKLLIAGAIHVYVKDAEAYDAAATAALESLKALAAEAGQNTTLTPVQMLMTVHAAG